MAVPLIQNRAQPYLTKTTFFAANGGTAAFGGAIRFANADAVKISLSKETPPASAADLQPTTQLGYGERALSRLRDVVKRIQELSIQTPLDDSQKKAVTDELTGLGVEFDRILGSSDIKNFLNTAQAVQDANSGGISGYDISKSLESQRGSLGDRFLNLVASGANSNLSQITSSISDLSGTSASQLLSDPSLASQISDKIELALRAFDAPQVASSQVQAAETAGEAPSIIIPEKQELQFVSSDGLSISLKGYTGKGLLTAALTGVKPDSKGINQLVVQLPKTDDKKESEKDANPLTPDDNKTVEI